MSRHFCFETIVVVEVEQEQGRVRGGLREVSVWEGHVEVGERRCDVPAGEGMRDECLCCAMGVVGGERESNEGSERQKVIEKSRCGNGENRGKQGTAEILLTTKVLS